MSVVGSFPGLEPAYRRAVRGPVNPLDKSTIVSIYPRDIREKNLTIFPGKFHIPAGSYANPTLVVVGPSSWWKDVGEEQPLLEIPVHSVQVADGVVNDWMRGMLACDMGESRPGVFFIPGEVNLAELRSKKYAHLLDQAKRRQENWFKALVKIADVLWSRTNGNPLAINDDARIAATELNLKNKPWLQDFKMVEMQPCRACGTLMNPAFPVCATCKAINNVELAKQLDIKFAQ